MQHDRALTLLLSGLLLSAVASMAVSEDPIPHVNGMALENYQAYRYAADHRAFAIAPGGAWAWQSGLASAESAREAALAACQEHTEQRCVAYAVNDAVVFDRTAWPTLWGPYPSTEEAAAAVAGTRRGQRMPDLRFFTPSGEERTLASLHGRVVLLHFWGSWCPPCMSELPVLSRFVSNLEDQHGDRVEVVLLQMREPFADATAWVARNGIDGLPLFNSGTTGTDDTTLALADGGQLPDREVTARFPTSYVLDRNGVVLFRHVGPIDDWDGYLPFFTDAVR